MHVVFQLAAFSNQRCFFFFLFFVSLGQIFAHMCFWHEQHEGSVQYDWLF